MYDKEIAQSSDKKDIKSDTTSIYPWNEKKHEDEREVKSLIDFLCQNSNCLGLKIHSV